MARTLATFLLLLLPGMLVPASSAADPDALTRLTSPILFRGDATTAYRDPRGGAAFLWTCAFPG